MRRKKQNAAKWLGLLSLLGSLSAATASSITYSAQYHPTTLPQEAAGTLSDPSWYFYTGNATTNTASANDGILTASTMGSTGLDRLQFWQVGQDIPDGGREYGTPYNAWDGDALIGSTVDFTIRVTASAYDSDPSAPGGFQIFVGDDEAAISFYFTTTGISALGAASYAISDHPNTDYQTFRIVLQYDPAETSNRAWLFEAGNNTPLFSYLAPVGYISGDVGLNYVNFGTYTTQSSGAWDLGFIGWSNSVAEYSAPDFIAPIPEPATGWLVVTGVFTALSLRKRNAAHSKPQRG